MGFRFGAVITCLVLAYALLAFHLYSLGVKGGGGVARAETLYWDYLRAARGTIYVTDKNGAELPVALNKEFPTIYAVPKTVEDPAEASNQLAPLLGVSVADLQARLGKPGDTYELLKEKADPAVAEKVDALKIKGIYTKMTPERYYPYGTFAAQLVGYVGPNSDNPGESGHYGLEEFYDKSLQGEINGGAPQAGKDLVLTVDPNIQVEAERVLKNVVAQYRAWGGSVIVEEPQTGKILAMGSAPSFDPNNYAASPLEDFVNPVVQQMYEPGSVFKVVTMSAGIDAGKITPETTYVDAGSITMNGRTIQNFDFKTHGPYGKVTMTNVIEHSINTGAVFVERLLGRDLFTEYVKRFGFGEKTGITLPGELKGDVRRLSSKERDIAFATASYGQGVAVTPLGLANAVAAVANGGVLMRPYLDASMSPQAVRRVISAETAKEVAGMMVSAVDKATIAKIDGYTIAGKTGTAYIPDFEKGGYTDNVINTYVGFGPTSNPRFVILIKLNQPSGAPLAGFSVVPAFRELAQFILNYYNIPPDRI